MWEYLFEDITHNGFTITVVIMSLILSLISLFFINKTETIRKKLSLMYSHLFFLFLPLIFIALMWSCQMPIIACVQKMILWVVPLSVLGTFTLGFFVLPSLYRLAHKSNEIDDKSFVNFVKRYSEIMNIKKVPKIYFINTAKQIAHTFTNFKPSIFISVGMFETLKRKELEAVILHELHHIKTQSSFLKFSTKFVRFVSPIAKFTILDDDLNEEERNADNFAIKIQNTTKYLLNAKKSFKS